MISQDVDLMMHREEFLATSGFGTEETRSAHYQSGAPGVNVALIEWPPLLADAFVIATNAIRGVDHCSSFADLSSWLVDRDACRAEIVILKLHRNMNIASLEANTTIADLRAVTPRVPFVLLGHDETFAAISKALELGAAAYVPMSASLRLLVGVLQLVRAGGRFIPASSFDDLLASKSPPRAPKRVGTNNLSRRQILVAKALQKGTSNKVIAYDLNMCESTVKVHVRQIMKKLGARNRTQVAVLTNSLFSDEPVP